MRKRSFIVSGSERVTAFERIVVFRVTRVFFVVTALIAVVGFCVGAFSAVRSLFPQEAPLPTKVAPLPPRSPVDYAAVEAQLRQAPAEPSGVPNSDQGEPTAQGTVSPSTETNLERLLKELRALFPQPPYSWLDVVEKACVAPTAFGCLSYENRVKERGIRPRIAEALGSLERSEIEEYLEVIIRVLKQVPVERRLEFLEATIRAEQRSRSEYETRKRRHEREAEEAKSNHETAVALAKSERSRRREWAVYGMATALGTLIIVSLFLAILAIERQTRALQNWQRLQNRREPATGDTEAAA